MPHYKLVPSGRPDVQVDEIILSKNDDGSTEHSLHRTEARSIPEKLLDEANELAGRLGYSVQKVEVDEDEQESQETDVEQRQTAGLDTQGAAPAVDDGGNDQSSTALQQGQPGTGSETSDYGSSATSETSGQIATP